MRNGYESSESHKRPDPDYGQSKGGEGRCVKSLEKREKWSFIIFSLKRNVHIICRWEGPVRCFLLLCCVCWKSESETETSKSQSSNKQWFIEWSMECFMCQATTASIHRTRRRVCRHKAANSVAKRSAALQALREKLKMMKFDKFSRSIPLYFF